MNFSPLPPQSPSALGQHVIADFYEAGELESCHEVEGILRAAAEAAGAVVLEVKLHDFGDRSGFTGVALLAESHISVHTWPEYGYAAIDIFMCGVVEVGNSLEVLRQYFTPKRETVQTLNRGALPIVPVSPVLPMSSLVTAKSG